MVEQCKVFDFNISQISVIDLISGISYQVMDLLSENVSKCVGTNYPYVIANDLMKVIQDISGDGEYLIQFISPPTLCNDFLSGYRLAIPVDRLTVSVTEFNERKNTLNLYNTEVLTFENSEEINNDFGDGDFFDKKCILDYCKRFFKTKCMIQVAFYSPVLKIKRVSNG